QRRRRGLDRQGQVGAGIDPALVGDRGVDGQGVVGQAGVDQAVDGDVARGVAAAGVLERDVGGPVEIVSGAAQIDRAGDPATQVLVDGGQVDPSQFGLDEGAGGILAQFTGQAAAADSKIDPDRSPVAG